MPRGADYVRGDSRDWDLLPRIRRFLVPHHIAIEIVGEGGGGRRSARPKPMRDANG
jgi:hypothetical protein